MIEIRKVVISGRKGILVGRRMGALPGAGNVLQLGWDCGYKGGFISLCI